MPRRQKTPMGSRRAVPKLRQAFGARLRALRQERHLSQQQLGAIAGLSGKFQGEIERTEKSVSLDSAYRIAKALEVPLVALIPSDGQANPEAEAIYAMLASKPPAKVREIARIVRALSA